jgi:hypothetical protein
MREIVRIVPIVLYLLVGALSLVMAYRSIFSGRLLRRGLFLISPIFVDMSPEHWHRMERSTTTETYGILRFMTGLPLFERGLKPVICLRERIQGKHPDRPLPCPTLSSMQSSSA